MKKLRDVLPREFFESFTDTRAGTMLDVEVKAEVDGTVKRWPGPHKNVYNWWELADGRAVGWNENPARGFSFPTYGRKSNG